MDNIYKALADPTRRRILEILKKRDMTVSDIGANFSITGASLSHHLDILKRARLVVSQRQGKFIIYSLNTSVFEEIARSLFDVFKK